MRVVFAGTPEFAAVALRALYEAGFTIPLVLTQPDRPAGRGMKLQASAVKQYALDKGIEVLQPVSLRMDAKDPQRAAEAAAAHARLLDIDYDVMVVAAYGLILPRSTLDIKPCINIHGSLLPRWRGAAPIHRAIESGDTVTGVTIMQMEEGLDTGPMLLTQEVPIYYHDTTGSLHDKLAALGGAMIVDALRRMKVGNLPATVQPEEGVTYAAKISKEEAALDFSLDADVLERKVRAFNPFPGAHAKAGDVVLKLWQATTGDDNHGRPPGEILVADEDDGIYVACGRGSLKLLQLQKPGGKRLDAAEFLKGFSLEDRDFN
ncbi:MAG: methionyl-tRNA formyltransferase [Pseudomonadota bacterium]|nr:methionyl-tRNA formyltransferase [Pseudomonadota bacterium]